MTTTRRKGFPSVDLPSSVTVDGESVPCWLRGGSKIKKNGRKWELEVSYLHAKRGVDTDIYQEA